MLSLGFLAPTLGKAIKNNVGGALDLALKAVGLKNGTESDLSKALKNASPEQIAELKRIDNEYKERMLKLGIDFEKLENEEMESARQRQIKLKDRTPNLLAFGLLGMFLIYAVLLFTVDLSEKNSTILNMISNAFETLKNLLLLVGGYFYGSSKSSSEKNSIIAELKK